MILKSNQDLIDLARQFTHTALEIDKLNEQTNDITAVFMLLSRSQSKRIYLL